MARRQPASLRQPGQSGDGHELTHVVRQRQCPVRVQAQRLGVTDDDPLERQAVDVSNRLESAMIDCDR
jgi:hypothetical protein